MATKRKVEAGTTPTITYTIQRMRVIRPSAAVADRNPDLLFTVVGDFYTADGKRRLTIPGKAITRQMRATGLVAVDLATGTLTVPAGTRGRPKVAGEGQEAVNALLADLDI